MIDTHAHLNLKQFDADRHEIVDLCRDLGIKIIDVGIDYQSSVRAIKLAQEYEGIYAAVGIYPGGQENISLIEPLLQEEKVVAIGEAGLDFSRSENDQKRKQQQVLLADQIKLAQGKKLPLVIHCRQAFPELLSLLADYDGLSSVIHSFSGDLATAGKLLGMGCYLGFSGLIFRLELDEVVRSTPMDRILVETDSPFLSPPSLNNKRNAPHLGLQPVLDKIAFLKKLPVAEIILATTENANRLFKLEKYEKISAQ
jgi:TatD DNase family protein